MDFEREELNKRRQEWEAEKAFRKKQMKMLKIGFVVMLTVICSFSNSILEDAAIAPLCQGKLLLNNYPTADECRLHPWEARVYLL